MSYIAYPKPTPKQRRAFAYLALREKYTVEEMATMLGEPLSTMQKPDNAYKRLTGALGEYTKKSAFEALAKVDRGFKQVEAATAHTDHKMVSDLVAMRYAMKRFISVCLDESQDETTKKNIEAKARASLRADYQTAIDGVTSAFDSLLGVAPSDNEDLAEALEELTDAIIALEELK